VKKVVSFFGNPRFLRAAAEGSLSDENNGDVLLLKKCVLCTASMDL